MRALLLLLILTSCTYFGGKNRSTASIPSSLYSQWQSPYSFYRSLFEGPQPLALFIGEYHALKGHKETLADVSRLASEGLIDRVVFEQILGSKNAIAEAYLVDDEAIENSWLEAFYFCNMSRHHRTFYNQATRKNQSIHDIQYHDKNTFKNWFETQVSEGLPARYVAIAYCEAQGVNPYFRQLKEARKTNPNLKICGMEYLLQNDQLRLSDSEEEEEASRIFQTLPTELQDLGNLAAKRRHGGSQPNTRDLYMSHKVSECFAGNNSGVVYSGAGHARKWMSLPIPDLVPVFVRDIFEQTHSSYRVLSAYTLSDGRGEASVRDVDDSGACLNCDIFPNFNPEFQRLLGRVEGNKVVFSSAFPDEYRNYLQLSGEYTGFNLNLSDMFEIFILQNPTEGI